MKDIIKAVLTGMKIGAGLFMIYASGRLDSAIDREVMDNKKEGNKNA